MALKEDGPPSGSGDVTILLANSAMAQTVDRHSPIQIMGFNLMVWDLTVQKIGGEGTLISTPSGINCGPDCISSYIAGISVTLTVTTRRSVRINLHRLVRGRVLGDRDLYSHHGCVKDRHGPFHGQRCPHRHSLPCRGVLIPDAQSITLTSSETAAIWYTLDGSDPATSVSKTAYNRPIAITAQCHPRILCHRYGRECRSDRNADLHDRQVHPESHKTGERRGHCDEQSSGHQLR